MKWIAVFLALSVVVLASGCTSTESTGSVVEGYSDSGADESVNEPSCLNGIENDPYPGLCGSYVDRDGNGICDLSE